jgi:hypothetical protein
VAGLTLACSIQQVCVDCQTGWLRLNTRGSSRLCPSDPFIPASIRVDRRHRAECGLGFRVCYVCCTGYGFGVGGMNRSNCSGCSRSGTEFCNLEAAIGRHCRQLPRRRGGGAIGPGRLRSWTRTANEDNTAVFVSGDVVAVQSATFDVSSPRIRRVTCPLLSQ